MTRARKTVREIEAKAGKRYAESTQETALPRVSPARPLWSVSLIVFVALLSQVGFAQTDASPGDVVRVENAEAAAQRAEEAAEAASLAARAADKARREGKGRTERLGPYLGAAFFYAAEEFDDRIIVKSSLGGAGFVGYRLHPIFALEVRYEGFAGFDLQSSLGTSEIDGYAVTANAKAYPFRGPVQPFVGFGIGGIQLREKVVFNGGARRRAEESDVVFRLGAGLDFWLNDFLVLNTEVAYLAPGDELSNLDMTLLNLGMTYRF